MKKQIAKFSLGGIPWKVIIDNNSCGTNETAWVRWLGIQTIGLRDNYDTLLNYDVLERNLWDAIFYIIFSDHMEYRNISPKKSYAFSGLIKQSLQTLTCKPGEWDGTFEVGAVTYIVKVNNESGKTNNFFGRCNFNTRNIELTTENCFGLPHTDSFIGQTLTHEMLHAVAFELGLGETKLNTEKFINTAATFIYEVYKTLKIKFPDE
jgi:hypothetical protein